MNLFEQDFLFGERGFEVFLHFFSIGNVLNHGNRAVRSIILKAKIISGDIDPNDRAAFLRQRFSICHEASISRTNRFESTHIVLPIIGVGDIDECHPAKFIRGKPRHV